MASKCMADLPHFTTRSEGLTRIEHGVRGLVEHETRSICHDFSKSVRLQTRDLRGCDRLEETSHLLEISSDFDPTGQD